MRTFAFEIDTTGTTAALDVIEAALEDEGLVLLRGLNTPDRIKSVREPYMGSVREVYYVPDSRIVPFAPEPDRHAACTWTSRGFQHTAECEAAFDLAH